MSKCNIFSEFLVFYAKKIAKDIFKLAIPIRKNKNVKGLAISAGQRFQYLTTQRPKKKKIY